MAHLTSAKDKDAWRFWMTDTDTYKTTTRGRRKAMYFSPSSAQLSSTFPCLSQNEAGLRFFELLHLSVNSLPN